MTGWGWAMMVLWSFVWIGLLGVALWAVAQWARGGAQRPASAQQPPKAARELLDDRLARGEIDLDEYKARRAALE